MKNKHLEFSPIERHQAANIAAVTWQVADILSRINKGVGLVKVHKDILQNLSRHLMRQAENQDSEYALHYIIEYLAPADTKLSGEEESAIYADLAYRVNETIAEKDPEEAKALGSLLGAISQELQEELNYN